MDAPKTYRIEHISDLLDIPLESREQCLKEIQLVLCLAVVAGIDGPTHIDWTDDGDQSCALVDQYGDAFLTLDVKQDV